jgi:hypothetical protein
MPIAIIPSEVKAAKALRQSGGVRRVAANQPPQVKAEAGVIAGKPSQTAVPSSNVQLSAQGQIKSAYAQTQLAARSLTQAASAGSVDDVKQAAQTLASNFNRTSKPNLAAPGSSLSANRNLARAPALSEPRPQQPAERPAAAPANLEALKGIGISQGPDRSLTIDTKTLDNALQQSPDSTRKLLADLGQNVDRASSRALGEERPASAQASAPAPAPENAPREQARQEEQRASASVALQAVAQQADALTQSLAGGLATIQRSFSA